MQNIAHRFVPTYQPYDFSKQAYQNNNTLPFGSQPSIRPSIDTYNYGYYEPPHRLPDINSLYQQPKITHQSRPSGSFSYTTSQTRSAGYTSSLPNLTEKTGKLLRYNLVVVLMQINGQRMIVDGIWQLA